MILYRIFKRTFDFTFAILLIIMLSPVFIFTILIIWISLGNPIIFKQIRAGYNNESFMIYKFRSMLQKTDKLKSDTDRINWIGRLLRLFRLDELPQLFNIVKGDMSFIGPRPLLPEYLPYYTETEKRRHEVKPGLSGLSQVSNLNYLKWEEQFEYDVYYVDHLSFKLDTIIFLKTITHVLLPNKMIESGFAGRTNFKTYRFEQIGKFSS